jgi:hypothetical protein
VKVVGLTGVTQIAAGGEHSLALRSDGTVVSWGFNVYGAIGDGTVVNRLTPVAVPGLTGVTQISAGDYYSLALRSNGGVVAWGYNGYGEIGDGTVVHRLTPVAVSGLTGITRVSAGADHSVALGSDGNMRACGDNIFGQLGDNTNANRTTPVMVDLGVFGMVTQVATGGNHTLAKVGPPELTAKAKNTGNGNVGTKLTCTAAFLTATSSVSYSWLRDGVAIPGATTAIYTPVAGDAGHKATCQVTGKNGMGATTTAATITIHAPAHFNAGTPPTAHLGKEYSYTFTTTGSPTPKVTLASGTLPPGLKLATNGTLSGKPTHKGTYTFALKATNGIGAAAKANKSVTVK